MPELILNLYHGLIKVRYHTCFFTYHMAWHQKRSFLPHQQAISYPFHGFRSLVSPLKMKAGLYCGMAATCILLSMYPNAR